MAKLAKQMYYSASKGEKKLNCYKINIPKRIVKQTDFKETDELNITVKDNKIIIEKNKP